MYFFFIESSQAVKHGGCFSADSKVRVSSGEQRRVGDLQLGERVLSVDTGTGELSYSEVIMFLDRSTTQRREFLRVSTTSGRTLTLTPAHMVLLGDPNAPNRTAFAEDLVPGAQVLVRSSVGRLVAETVEAVQPVLLTGVYAPLTAAGTIVVDDVAASCYAVIDSQRLAHWSFAPVRLAVNVRRALSSAWGLLTARTATAPRVTAAAPDTGEHWYARLLYRLAEFLIPRHLNND